MSHVFQYDITKNPFYLETQKSDDNIIDILINVMNKIRSEQDEEFLINTLMPAIERADLDEVHVITGLLR